jgi:hypothetical protein
MFACIEDLMRYTGLQDFLETFHVTFFEPQDIEYDGEVGGVFDADG